MFEWRAFKLRLRFYGAVLGFRDVVDYVDLTFQPMHDIRYG